MITDRQIAKALTYEQYFDLVTNLLAQGKTTGDVQSEEYIEYAKINLQRMKRLNKTIELSEELKSALQKIKDAYFLVIISEGWCGDAAQNVPIFAAIERFNPKLEIKILLRDENPEVMDQYLTNGTRSIPKVICLEKNSLKEIFVWGPRPLILQNIVTEMLKNKVSKEEKSLTVQRWYNADATLATQKELVTLFNKM